MNARQMAIAYER